MSLSILLVDDEQTVRETLCEFFEHLGHRVRVASSAAEARAIAAADAPDLMLADLRLPDGSGLALSAVMRAEDPDLGVIVLTGHADVATAVRAMREGVLDFLEKPIDLEALAAAVDRAAELMQLRREVAVLRTRQSDVASENAESWESLERLVELAARNDDVPVLIIGETGTGKGFVARRIHERSGRASQPFVEINGASLSATFLESEMFGHERGAFTDAKQAKRGLLEVAGRGTLFLDEVGEIAPEVQPKLLKVLEERTFRRLGGTSELRSDARVITATHRPIAELARTGQFRADLYYRLQVLTLNLPPLRDRRFELPALAQTFLPKDGRLSASARRAIEQYDWPGNVRELKNTLWRARLLADGGLIEPAHLGLPLSGERLGQITPTMEDSERAAIVSALQVAGGNRVETARLLGIARSTLQQKLKRFRLG